MTAKSRKSTPAGNDNESDCRNSNIKIGRRLMVTLMAMLVATSANFYLHMAITFHDNDERIQMPDCIMRDGDRMPVAPGIGGVNPPNKKDAAILHETAHSTTSTIQPPSSESPASISTLDMATEFYKRHSNMILSTINRNTELFWNPGLQASKNVRSFENRLGERLTYLEEETNKNPEIDTNNSSSHYIVSRDACTITRAFKTYHHASTEPFPHVAIMRMNENWGSFSRFVKHRTTANPIWTYHNTEEQWMENGGCSQADVEAYLDSPELKVAVTLQHQYLDHPKVISLPLGFRTEKDMPMILQKLANTVSIHHHHHHQAGTGGISSSSSPSYLDRPQLLMINSHPHKWRNPLLDKVIKNFYGTVKNTYGYNGHKTPYKAYWNEMRRSKFILSPGGLGLDCYRHWEAIHMGTFPVIEHLNRADGWYRTLADLPVAWIDRYENLTPDFLEREYVRLISKAHTYKYEKLTRQYWIQMIQSALHDDDA